MPTIPIASLKKYIGRGAFISPEDLDWLANECQPMCESRVEECLGFSIAQAERTEYYPPIPAVYRENENEQFEVQGSKLYYFQGAQAPSFKLNHTPVRSVAHVYVDAGGYFGSVSGSFAAGTELVFGTDYYLSLDYNGMSRSGLLYARNGAWSPIPGSIKVVYTSGFTAGELAGQYACFKNAILRECAAEWNRYQQMKVGFAGKEITNEGIGGGATSSYVQEDTGQYCICDAAYQCIEQWVSFQGLEL